MKTTLKTMAAGCAAVVLALGGGCGAGDLPEPAPLDPAADFQRFTLDELQVPILGTPLQQAELLEGRVVGGSSCLAAAAHEALLASDEEVAPVRAALERAGWQVDAEGGQVMAHRGPWLLTGTVEVSPSRTCGLGWSWAARKPALVAPAQPAAQP